MQSKAVLVVLLILALVAVPAMAVSQKAAANGINGKGAEEHLYLFEKNSTNNWSIVDGGAWGKLNFNLKTDKFVFNGHGVQNDTEYALISYAEPWPGTGSAVLATGTSTDGGDIHISGLLEGLVVNDYAPDAPGDYQDTSGSKIWLVPTTDFSESGGVITQFTAWNPDGYLFEHNLI